MEQQSLASRPDRLFPRFIEWPDWRLEADEAAQDLLNEHLEAEGPGDHLCGYRPESDKGACEICDAHSESCSRCHALYDAFLGIECLDGDPPFWANAIDQERLSRTAKEVVPNLIPASVRALASHQENL